MLEYGITDPLYYDGHRINFSSSSGYPTIFVDGKNVLLHRYVWEKFNGKIPKGFQVHHKDKNRSNWQIENLELVNNSEHHKFHATENGLGKCNKGVLKKHSSGFCEGAKAVILSRGKETVEFDSVTQAAKFLGVKKVSDVSRVLTGKRKTIKGWGCRYRTGESF